LTTVLLFAIALVAQGRDAPTEQTDDTALLALVPSSGAFEGLEREAEPKVYSHDALPDYIDGDAETYYTYGVGSTVATGYKDGVGGRLELDIFDMKTPLSAFGVYAHRRPDDPKLEEMGTQAYTAGRQVVCLAGGYYVVVRSVSRKPEGLERARKLAVLVADATPKPHELPAELAYFPTDGKLENTEAWHPSAFLGLSAMPPLFDCGYRVPDSKDDETYRLAFSVLDDDEAGEKCYAEMCDSLREKAVSDPSTETVELAGMPFSVLVVELKYRGLVVVGRSCRVILAAVGAPRDETLSALGRLAQRMKDTGVEFAGAHGGAAPGPADG
jgi:hypothetical protein